MAWLIPIGFFTGSCYYIYAFLRDLSFQISELGAEKKKPKSKKRGINQTLKKTAILHNEIFMWILYKNATLFHEKRKKTHRFFFCIINSRIMGTTRDIMTWPLFFQLLGFISIVVMALFSLNQPFESNATKVVSVMNVSWQLILWYNFCSLSESVTEYTNEVVDNLYGSDWFTMTVSEKKALIFMLGRSQQEFRFTCLGFFDCSLTIFSAVIIYITLLRRTK